MGRHSLQCAYSSTIPSCNYKSHKSTFTTSQEYQSLHPQAPFCEHGLKLMLNYLQQLTRMLSLLWIYSPCGTQNIKPTHSYVLISALAFFRQELGCRFLTLAKEETTQSAFHIQSHWATRSLSSPKGFMHPQVLDIDPIRVPQSVLPSTFHHCMPETFKAHPFAEYTFEKILHNPHQPVLLISLTSPRGSGVNSHPFPKATVAQWNCINPMTSG